MNKFYKNWGNLLISNVISTAISFFTFLLLAKKLTPDEYGSFNTIMATVTVFAAFANNVISGTVLNRELVVCPDTGKHLVKKAAYLRTFGFLLTSIALVIYYLSTNQNNEILLISLIVLTFSNIVWDFCEQIAFGYFVTKITTVLKICLSVLWLIVVIVIPPNKDAFNSTIIFYTLLMLLSSIAYWIFDKKLLDKKNKKSEMSIKQLIMMSAPYMWMRVLGSFSEQIPILLLNGYVGASQVAYYSVGARFVLPITIMINTGISALFPFLTKLFKEDKESYKKNIVLGFNFVLIFGTTTAVILTLTSSYWLVWIMGEKYSSAVEAFNYQVWFAVCLGIDLIFSMILSASYKQKTLAIITTIDFLILVPILYFAIPYGAKGVAIAKLISVLITVTYHMFVAVAILKIKLNNSMFYLSCCYFILLLSLIVSSLESWIKFVISALIIIVFLLYKNSPLRILLMVFKNKLSMKTGVNQ